MSDLETPEKRRAPPFSIRFSEADYQRLDAHRQGMRRGTYIRAKVFDGVPLKGVAAVGDRAALAQALALLGQSRYASNLNQIAHLAHIGALTFSPEEQEELAGALKHLAEIRSLLLKATGVRKDT